MADGEVRVTLDTETERRLRAAADAVGRSMDDYARGLIVEALDDGGCDADIQIADLAERTGASRSLEEAMAHFRAALHAQVKTSQ